MAFSHARIRSTPVYCSEDVLLMDVHSSIAHVVCNRGYLWTYLLNCSFVASIHAMVPMPVICIAAVLYACMSVYVCIYVCIYVCMPYHVCMSVCMLSICLYVCLYVCIYVCNSVCLYACMSTCMSTCMSVCLYVHISLYRYLCISKHFANVGIYLVGLIWVFDFFSAKKQIVFS